MADQKISQLTAATTPLSGTEVLPVVQGGVTTKVSIANVTAGRSVGAQQVNITAAAGGGFTTPALIADDGTAAARIVFLGAPYAGVPAGKPWIHSYQDIYVGSDAGTTFNVMSGGTKTLGVDGTGNATVPGNFVVGTAGKGITTGGATALGFGVNNAVDAMTIDASKNIGVGTASPAVKLHVSGTLDEVFRLTSTGSPYISWYAGVTRRGYIQAQSGSFTVASDTAIPLLLSTNSTERLRIKSTGGVRYVPLDAAPATPDAGEVYYDNLTNKLRCYNGTTWNDLF